MIKIIVLPALLALVIFTLNSGIFVDAQADDGCPNIVKRAQWGAMKSTNVSYQLKPVKFVVIHHTVTEACQGVAACKEIVKSIQDAHQTGNNWSDIGYNFLIANGGNAYEGIGWHRVGAHTRGYNVKSIGIAFIGDFSSVLPTKKALTAVAKLLQCGVNLGELDEDYKLYGARQLSATASPGNKLFSEIRTWDHFDSSPVV